MPYLNVLIASRSKLDADSDRIVEELKMSRRISESSLDCEEDRLIGPIVEGK